MDPEVEAELLDEVGDRADRVRSPKATRPRGGAHPTQQPQEHDTRRNISIRLGKRWSQIVTEVKEGQYTWAEFAEGLDPEELVRGQLKDRHGGFSGRPPALVPRAFHDACLKELHTRFNSKVRERLLSAVDELIDLSRVGGGMDAKDRAKTLVYLIERVVGPVPKVVQVSADAPWEGLVASGLLRPSADEGAPPTAPPRRDRYAKRRQVVDPSEDKDE